MRIGFRYFLAFSLLILALSACNIPSNAPNAEATRLAATLFVAQTQAAAQQSAATGTLPPIPVATDTSPPSVIPTPANPLVIKDSLCWVGPGVIFEVVSAIQKGTRVELLGRGSVDGWWVVRNPIYKDPCWIPAENLQIEPGYNVSGLQIYYPPPTPTYTPTSTPTATPTP